MSAMYRFEFQVWKRPTFSNTSPKKYDVVVFEENLKNATDKVYSVVGARFDSLKSEWTHMMSVISIVELPLLGEDEE